MWVGNTVVGISSSQTVLIKHETFSAFGTAAASNGGNIDERTAKQLMEEEAAAMEKFRSGASASNPFAAAPAGEKAEETPNILDLFGVASPAPAAGSVSQPPPAQAQQSTAASDDLLQLTGNPFANMLNGEDTHLVVFSYNSDDDMLQPLLLKPHLRQCSRVAPHPVSRDQRVVH